MVVEDGIIIKKKKKNMNILYLFFLSVTKKRLMPMQVHSNHNPSRLGCMVRLPSLSSCWLPWSISEIK